MTHQLHYLPDGRLKVGDHYITDKVAVELIRFLIDTSPNFPFESFRVILDILELGSEKYPPASWRSETTDHHAGKALGHLKDFVYGVTTNSEGEDTLAHALTRLAMAVSVRGEDK